MSIIFSLSASETARKAVARRAISSRSMSRRSGLPSNDQVCSCASNTGAELNGDSTAAQRFEPNLCA